MKKIIILSLIMILGFSFNVSAAGYGDIDRQFSGYGVSTSKNTDKKIGSEFTVGELVNKGKTAVKVSDKFTAKKIITFNHSCSSEISSSIGVTDGAVSGALGAKINAKYAIASNFTYSYSKTITKKVPKKTTYTVKAQAKGDELNVWYKQFAVWITIGSGKGTVYIPKYYSFITC